MSLNYDTSSFFQFTVDLQPSGNRIPDEWSVIFERLFNKLSNDTKVAGFLTCDSLIIYV